MSILLVGLFVFELRQRLGVYWYEVQRNYRFNFTGPDLTSVPVEVSHDGFICPSLNGTWDTSFLRITISSGLSALWFEPSVEIESTAHPKSRQYFERRVRGDRYLNLGALFGEESCADTRVKMQGHHLRWPPQTGELLLFRNAPISTRKILILAPHPDDAEIAAFGLYAFRNSFIVTITTGNYVNGAYEHIYDDPSAQDILKGQLRTWDSIVVPMWGGVAPTHSLNLGYFTGKLERMHADPQAVISNDLTGVDSIRFFRRWNIGTLLQFRAAASTWESLIEDLSVVLQSVQPEIIVSPHPVLDANFDHRFTTIALLEALRRCSDNKALLYLYTNHHTKTEYYPFGPSNALITLPPWFDSTVPFGGVYSQPLDDRRQIEKLFALDAMHDLRPAPRVFVEQRIGAFLHRVQLALADLRHEPFGTYSYYRRAVRPNELFFVYSPADREALQSYIKNIATK